MAEMSIVEEEEVADISVDESTEVDLTFGFVLVGEVNIFVSGVGAGICDKV